MKRVGLILAMLMVCSSGFAAEEKLVTDTKKEIVVPIVIEKDINLYEYCLQMKEKLRLEHNAKGQEFKDKKITQEQWDAYLKDEFFPKDVKLSTCVVYARQSIKGKNTYSTSDTDIMK